MKIAIDIDDTTLHFLEPFLGYYNNKNNTNFKKDQMNSYNFWELTGGTREDAIKYVDEFYNSPKFDNLPPIDDSIESIKLLSQNNEITFLTSRPLNMREKTESWLKSNFQDMDHKLILTNAFKEKDPRSKAEICKKLGISIIIEDNISYALECAEHNMRVILFDQPWNQNTTRENITRVTSWLEAREIVNSLIGSFT